MHTLNGSVIAWGEVALIQGAQDIMGGEDCGTLMMIAARVPVRRAIDAVIVSQKAEVTLGDRCWPGWFSVVIVM